jgi:hypothetical protein
MAASRAKVSAKSKGRSRLSNGHLLPRGVDSRSSYARRLRDVHALFLSECPDASQAEQAILWAAAVQKADLEAMVAVFATRGHSEPQEAESFDRKANSMRRNLESVGLKARRITRDITPPTVDQYIEHLRNRREASESSESSEAAE